MTKSWTIFLLYISCPAQGIIFTEKLFWAWEGKISRFPYTWICIVLGFFPPLTTSLPPMLILTFKFISWFISSLTTHLPLPYISSYLLRISVSFHYPTDRKMKWLKGCQHADQTAVSNQTKYVTVELCLSLRPREGQTFSFLLLCPALGFHKTTCNFKTITFSQIQMKLNSWFKSYWGEIRREVGKQAACFTPALKRE